VPEAKAIIRLKKSIQPVAWAIKEKSLGLIINKGRYIKVKRSVVSAARLNV
jgi:hypothetical protein